MGDCSMKTWRDEPITEKQKAFILSIQEDMGMNDSIVVPFYGKTKGEASDWIDKNNGKQFYSAYCPHENAGDRL